MQMVRKKKKPSTSYTNSFWADSFSYQPTQRGLEKKKRQLCCFSKRKTVIRSFLLRMREESKAEKNKCSFKR